MGRKATRRHAKGCRIESEIISKRDTGTGAPLPRLLAGGTGAPRSWESLGSSTDYRHEHTPLSPSQRLFFCGNDTAVALT